MEMDKKIKYQPVVEDVLPDCNLHKNPESASLHQFPVQNTATLSKSGQPRL